MQIKDIFSNQRHFFIVTLAFIWQALFFYLPILYIVLLSFIKFSTFDIYKSITFEYYYQFLNLTYLFIVIKSLFIAIITSILCFLVGYPVAHYLSFKAGRIKNFFLFLLILPFWTNFLLHIYAWFFVLERSGFLNNLLLTIGLIKEPLALLNSIGAVIAVMLYCYLPFMVLPIYSNLERIDRNLIEASYDLGATNWQTWRQVILPNSVSGIQTGFFLVYVPAFAEFVIPGLVGGEKFMFVGTVISQYILGNRTMSLGAAFTVLSCICLILFIIFAYVIGRKFFKKF